MQPITFPNLPQRSPYCTEDDVKLLIGQVAPIVNGTATTAQFTAAIEGAQKMIDGATKTFFSPRRIIDRLDGNNETRIVLPHKNVIAINEVQVYFSYPLSLARKAYDWDLLFDGGRKSGVIAFPSYTPNFAYMPFADRFFAASRNVLVDAWYGPTEFESGEVLTTTDHATFTFANPSVIKQTTQGSFPFEAGAAPKFFPTIYVNGIEVVNTTFAMASITQSGYALNEWQVVQDNLVFTVNQGANGIQSITFNQPLQPSDVVTADYVYWKVPDDIREACAKKAASTLLQSFATAMLPEQQFQGADAIQIDGSKIQYTNGQWSAVQVPWLAEVQDTIARNRVTKLPFGTGNRRTWGSF